MNTPLPRRDARAEFDALARRHYRRAYQQAYRLTGNACDAEDLTQDAFVRAYRFFDGYRRDWPFDLWLRRILIHRYIDAFRRRPRPDALPLTDRLLAEIPDPSADPERRVLAGEIGEPLSSALRRLPPRCRRTVLLADVQGLAYEDIAAEMHCSPGAVRSRLHRGRAMLRARVSAPA